MRRPDHRQRAPTLATHGKLQEPVSHHKRIFPLQLPLGYIPLPLLTRNAYTGRPPELVPCSCTAAFLVHLSDHSTKCPQLLFSCSKNLACPAHKAARSPHVLQRKAAPKPWKSTTEETEAGQQRVMLLAACFSGGICQKHPCRAWKVWYLAGFGRSHLKMGPAGSFRTVACCSARANFITGPSSDPMGAEQGAGDPTAGQSLCTTRQQ